MKSRSVEGLFQQPQAFTLIALAGIGWLIRQLDSIRVFPFPFVLFGKNLSSQCA